MARASSTGLNTFALRAVRFERFVLALAPFAISVDFDDSGMFCVADYLSVWRPECITFASLCKKGSIRNIVGLKLAAWMAVFRAMKPCFPRFYPRLDLQRKKEGGIG